VAGKLYGQGTGFEYGEAHPIKLKEVKYAADGKKISETERVEIVNIKRVVPPETAAIMVWLTNRQRDKWKHRVSNEHAGEGGGPVQMQVLGPKAPPKDVLESWASRYRAAVEKHAPVNAPKAAKLNGDEDER
jgi:hypothetical protein